MANGLYAVLSKYSNDPLVGLEENKDRKISLLELQSKGMNVEVEETAEQKVLIIRPSMQYVNW